jgi:hypothetical protein
VSPSLPANVVLPIPPATLPLAMLTTVN